MNHPPKTGDQAVDNENYKNWLKVLEIYRPDLFIDETDNAQDIAVPNMKTEEFTPDMFIDKPDDDRQNLIRDDLFNKDLGDDFILPHPTTIKIETKTESVTTEDFTPGLTCLPKTGDPAVDNENYENWLKVLEFYRPNLFIDDLDNLNEATIKNTPSLKWVRPADRFKQRVRHSDRKNYTRKMMSIEKKLNKKP